MTRALSGDVCIGNVGRPPAFWGMPDCGIIFMAMGFGGTGLLTGPLPGIPCIWGRAWLTPTPGGIPFGNPLGKPFGIPFGVPFGMAGAPELLGIPFWFRPGAFIICCWLGICPERWAAKFAWISRQSRLSTRDAKGAYLLLSYHLLAVVFMPLLQLHIPLILQPTELGRR